MNHIVRGRLLINVTLAALLLGLLFVVSRDAQAAAWPISAVVVIVIAVNIALQVRTGAQVVELRSAMNRLVGGEFEEPVPLGADEPLGSIADLMERLRKLLVYQLISRREFPGKVLRVEYGLTQTGRDLSAIIEQIRDLDERHAHRQA